VRRCATPQTPEETAFEADLRALLEADGWSPAMCGQLLDSALLVRRFGREVLEEAPRG
jgi:hypothetical protein